MKKMLPWLLIGFMVFAVAAYFFLKKKDGVEVPPVNTDSSRGGVIDATNAPSNRKALIKEMEKHIDAIYVKNDALDLVCSGWNDNVASYKATAKEWAKAMFDWCLAGNSWSFESQQEAADKNNYPLSLQMVQSIAWQLHGTQGLYNNLAWKFLENKIFELA